MQIERREINDWNSQTLPVAGQDFKFNNAILKTLPPSSIERLCLQRVVLDPHQEIEGLRRVTERLIFIEEGIASIATAFRAGSSVVSGVFGYEAILGVSSLLGSQLGPCTVSMLIGGAGFSSPIKQAREEFVLGGPFQELVLRNLQSQLCQATEAAACNARHNVEQRLARWLLVCSDHANTTLLRLSQKMLCNMLGTSRTTVTEAARRLKAENLISYARESIQICDFAALKQHACECYRMKLTGY